MRILTPEKLRARRKALSAGMLLTYADVCLRMLMYACVCRSKAQSAGMGLSWSRWRRGRTAGTGGVKL